MGLCFYIQPIPSAVHLYLLMVWGVYPSSSLQLSPTTTAWAWGNAAAHGNGSQCHQLSSEGLEEAGWRGNNAYPKSREEQPHGAIHREDVEELIWFIAPKTQGKTLGGTQFFFICTPMPYTKGLPGGADSFGAVSPAQRSTSHSYLSDRSVRFVSSSHTFQKY